MLRTRIIFKHELPFTLGSHTLDLHKSARLFSVQVQRGKLVLWEHHNDNEPAMEKKEIHIAFTGFAFTISTYDDHRHLGTIQHEGLVYHVFEVDPLGLFANF